MFGRQAVRDQVVEWVDRAIAVQDGVVRSHVAQVREGTPDATGEQVVTALEGQFLATMSGAGAAVGGAASVPGIGTTVAVGLSVAETAAFLNTTALFTFASADALGHPVGDMPRRRALFLSALLGDDAIALVGPADDGGTDGWGARLVALDDVAVAEINKTLEKWLVTRFGPRQGMLVIGRLVPFGIGAAVGAAGNAVTAKGVIARVRTSFAGVEPVVEAEPLAPPRALHGVPTGDDVPTGNDVATGNGVPTTEHDDPAVPAPTGKYLPLHALLAGHPGETVALTIDEIDAALPGGLPAAARRNPAWWGNDTGPRSPQARAWLAAGLKVTSVDLSTGTVHLTRTPTAALT